MVQPQILSSKLIAGFTCHSSMIDYIKFIVVFLSMLILVVSTLVGAILILAPSGGGMFSGLGVTFGIILIGCGNFVSCLLNIVYRLIGGRAKWQSYLTLAQVLLVGVSVAWIASSQAI